jgi:hypothetical protein
VHVIANLRDRRRLAAARREADAELVATTLPSPRLAWRTNELVSDEHRRAVAESILDVLQASRARVLPSASPLNRGGVRAEAELFLRIAAVLEDVRRPVRPRGILLVERLLAEGSGPLYARESEHRLHGALEEALQALDA